MHISSPHISKRRGSLRLSALALFVHLGMTGCSLNSSHGTFRYHHLETTGLTREIQSTSGESFAIVFSQESDQRSLAALDFITNCGVNGTVDEQSATAPFSQKLFIQGSLGDEVKMTPYGKGLPSPEKYRSFRLESWFVEVPVTIAEEKEDWVPGDAFRLRTVTSLSDACHGRKPLYDGREIQLEAFMRRE